jgi:hypothetical protein
VLVVLLRPGLPTGSADDLQDTFGWRDQLVKQADPKIVHELGGHGDEHRRLAGE